MADVHTERLGERSRSPRSCIQRNCELPPDMQDSDLRNLSRTSEVFQGIENEKHMSYRLPKPGVTAGRVIAHGDMVVESLLAKHSPMTFKIGITHCARFRWYHKPYGYKHTWEKFEHMTIIFAASNSIGPAFLEAALIAKFRSFPAAHCFGASN